MPRSSSSLDVEAATPADPGQEEEKIRDGGEIFGRLVAVRRAALGLSPEELAMRMGTGPSEIAHIEAGRAQGGEALQRLAAALEVEPGTGALWGSLDGRWLSAGVAIAAVGALMILNWPSADTEGRHPPRPLPRAVSAPPVVARVGTQTAAPVPDGSKPPGDRRRGRGRGNARSGSVSTRGKGPTSRVRPAPAPGPHGTLVAQQAPSQQGPSTQPVHSAPTATTGPSVTTGPPVTSPGNGNGPGGGNGPPGGTGPPGPGG